MMLCISSVFHLVILNVPLKEKVVGGVEIFRMSYRYQNATNHQKNLLPLQSTEAAFYPLGAKVQPQRACPMV